MVALVLLLHITQGIEGTAFVEFIECNEVGEIEHVDFFELGGGAVLWRHYVQAQIAVFDDFCIALANARGFQHNEVEAGCFGHIHRVLHVFAEGQVALAGGQRAHVHAGIVDAVHANAVAEECTSGFALAGVDRNDGDAFAFFDVATFFKIDEEAAHQFVHQARFACAASAGNAQNRGYLGFGIFGNHLVHLGAYGSV